MYQKLIIAGNVGRDCESRFTTQGTQVASFSVAVNKKRGGTDQTTWFRVTVWEKLAEICQKYVVKGMAVLCEGEVKQSDPYQKRDGTWASSLEMTAYTVQFIGSKGDAQPATTSQQANDTSDFDDEEQIPF